MRITEGQLRLLVRETLLTENVREGKAYLSLIEKFPNLENAIGTIADHRKAGSALIKWLFSRFIEEIAVEVHPIEDAIASIKSFASSFEKIESKWRSSPEFKKSISKFFGSPEWAYENSILTVIPFMTSDQIDKLPGLASRGKQDIEVNVSEEEMESDRVGKVGPWNLWMPTTRERSCAIAQYDPVTLEPKTTWCTARMAGSNLFYNYTGRPGADMTLFYVIKDNPESNEDWLSVGFINGKPSLEGKDGGISVDRSNKGLTSGMLRSILGPHHDEIMEILTQKNKSLGGKHPARQKIIDATQSIEAFHHIMKGLSKTEAMDMRELIAQEENVNPDVLDELANTKTDNEYFLAFIAQNPNTPPAALARMAAERGQYIEEWVARHPNTPPETLEMLAGRKEFHEYNVRYGVALNPNTPPKALRILARDEIENIRALVANRKDGSVPDDVFDLLADDREEGVLSAVALNEAAPDYVLSRLARSGFLGVRELVAANQGKNAVKALEHLAYDRDRDVRIAVAKNTRTPIKTLEMLAADLDGYINKPARATLHRISEQQAEADAPEQVVTEALLRRIIREALAPENFTSATRHSSGWIDPEGGYHFDPDLPDHGQSAIQLTSSDPDLMHKLQTKYKNLKQMEPYQVEDAAHHILTSEGWAAVKNAYMLAVAKLPTPEMLKTWMEIGMESGSDPDHRHVIWIAQKPHRMDDGWAGIERLIRDIKLGAQEARP